MSFVLFLSRIKTKKPRRVRPGFFQLTSRASHFWGKSGLRLCALRICFFNFARFRRADGLEQFFQAFENEVIRFSFWRGLVTSIWAAIFYSPPACMCVYIRLWICVYAPCGYGKVQKRFAVKGKTPGGLGRGWVG